MSALIESVSYLFGFLFNIPIVVYLVLLGCIACLVYLFWDLKNSQRYIKANFSYILGWLLIGGIIFFVLGYLQGHIRMQEIGITMVKIDAGDLVVGCTGGQEEGCYGDAQTAQFNAFEIGKTEVTQGQWKAVMGRAPPELHFKDCGDSCPVESVSWDDVQAFIRELNAQTGRTYRLPTENEWRAACMAGSPTKYCGGNDVNVVAWYGGNSDNKIHPVGQKQANAYGLCDMSGNVSEWMQDQYNNRQYVGVLCGGSWDDNPQYVRAENRGGNVASIRGDDGGIRLARTLP